MESNSLVANIDFFGKTAFIYNSSSIVERDSDMVILSTNHSTRNTNVETVSFLADMLGISRWRTMKAITATIIESAAASFHEAFDQFVRSKSDSREERASIQKIYSLLIINGWRSS